MTTKLPKVEIPKALLESSPKQREYKVLSDIKQMPACLATQTYIRAKYAEFLSFLKDNGFDIIMNSMFTNEYAARVIEDINDIIHHYKLYYSSCVMDMSSEAFEAGKKRAKDLYEYWTGM